MARIKPRNLGLLLATLLAVAGCSAPGDLSEVTGTVQVDGAPLAKGVITFVAVDGKSATAGSTIADGRFAAKMLPGKKDVQISAPKVVGAQRMYDAPQSPEVDVVEELLPARYNVQTELAIDAQAGTQHQDFDLKSE